MEKNTGKKVVTQENSGKTQGILSRLECGHPECSLYAEVPNSHFCRWGGGELLIQSPKMLKSLIHIFSGGESGGGGGGGDWAANF